MTGSSTTATLARTCLDGCDATSLADQATGIIEQLVWVGDILDIEQFHHRIGLRIEVIVHILQHVLNTNLLAIANAPYRVEFQPFSNCTLKNEYCRRATAADKVCTLRIKVRNGQGEDTVMVAVQQSDAVGSDEGCLILFTGVEDALLEFSSRLRLLTETCGDDDKRPDAFFCTEVVDIVRTILRRHHENGKVCLGDVLHIVESLDALDGVLLRVDYTQVSLVVPVEKITYDGPSGLVDVVGAADDDDASWM